MGKREYSFAVGEGAENTLARVPAEISFCHADLGKSTSTNGHLGRFAGVALAWDPAKIVTMVRGP